MHPGQKLKPGAVVRFEGAAGVLMAEVLERRFFGRRTIRLWSRSGRRRRRARRRARPRAAAALHQARRHARRIASAIRRCYARTRGSVAAPTAGLHFTPELLDALRERGVERAEITLHVGYGTFKPVRVERVEDHVVDPEHYEIGDGGRGGDQRARDEGRRVVAVGTTTTRALEDAALGGGGRVVARPGHGVALHLSRAPVPGRRRPADQLPPAASSLLMLVAAFAGRERVLAAYREAVEQRYRFYSYGDAMLVIVIADRGLTVAAPVLLRCTAP